MIKFILMSVLLVGCATQTPEHKAQTEFAQIQNLPSVSMDIKDTPTKPQALDALP